MPSRSNPVRTVIVGAGAAGAPLAARLSEDPEREVVLLEAGADEGTPSELLDGGMLHGAMPEHPANWAYPGELAPGLPYVVARGRILGGSSAVNGGYFVRAAPADFARWAEAGGSEWGYERALPILRDMENDLDYGDGGADGEPPHDDTPLHGDAGPMRVTRPPQNTPVSAAFHRAAESLGFAAEPDKNAAAAPGVGPVPSNIVGGVRVNTAMAYLEAVRSRVDVRAGTRALRVALEGGRAVGVETSSGFVAADEVVLAAGGISSPQLLMLSGLGPRAHLAELGIPLVGDLPVGVGFSDHPNLALEWRTKAPVVDRDAPFAFPTALNFDSASRDPSLPPRTQGDLEILLAAKPLGYLLTGRFPPAETLQFLIALQAPVSRGRLSLRSADPLDPPLIEYRYLQDEEDRRRMRLAVRTAVALLETPAYAELFDRLTALDDATMDDDEHLDAWIRAHLGTALHTCGTAPMGAVVDGEGRVRGTTGLRVADTSMLPAAPSRGPFNTAVFIGEFIARRMRRGS